VRPGAANDATAVATLAMLLLDDGVAGQKPWTQPIGGARPAEQEAIAVPPAICRWLILRVRTCARSRIRASRGLQLLG
jgi:hypothetical protein